MQYAFSRVNEIEYALAGLQVVGQVKRVDGATNSVCGGGTTSPIHVDGSVPYVPVPDKALSLSVSFRIQSQLWDIPANSCDQA